MNELEREKEWLQVIDGKSIMEPTEVDQMLQVTMPEQSMEIESIAAASIAWHKEQRNYEGYVNATYLYIMARRKTTELVLPHIEQGGNGSNQYASKGNEFMTLADFGFTKMQWNRRVHELNIGRDTIDEYFDEIKANGWQPSINGLMKVVDNRSGNRPSILDRFRGLGAELLRTMNGNRAAAAECLAQFERLYEEDGKK